MEEEAQEYPVPGNDRDVDIHIPQVNGSEPITGTQVFQHNWM